MNQIRPLSLIAGFGAALLLTACGQEDAEPVATEAADAVTEAAPATLPRTDSPEGASVFFITPANGETVVNPFTVEFGIDQMTVAPAGVNDPHSGHHHLLIDTGVPDTSLPIPADANHVHFGTGATSTELTLGPGEHTLQLLLGDHLHIPHNPPVLSDTITITVE